MKTTDIIPFSEYRKNMRANIARMNKTGRPVIITTNGKPDVVIISPKEFDRLTASFELLESARIIRQSIKAFEEGKGIPLDVAMAKLRQRIDAKVQECDTPSKLKKPRLKKSKTAISSLSRKTHPKMQSVG
jgi:prevent-host-death family protein